MNLSPFLITSLEQGAECIDQLPFSGDGRWLAAASAASTVVWEASTGRRHATLEGRRMVVGFHGDVVITSDETATTFWDLSTRQPSRTIPGFTAYDMTHEVLVGRSEDERTLQVRRLDGAVAMSVDVGLEALRACKAPLEGAIEGEPMAGYYGSVAASDNLSPRQLPEGLAIALTGRRIGLVSGGQLFLLDGESGETVRRISTLTQRDITAVSLTDRLLAFVTMGGTLGVHDAVTGEVMFHAALGSELRSVHLVEAAGVVATTCWDRANCTLVFPMSARGLSKPFETEAEDQSWRARVSPLGDVVAVGGDDGRVRLFRLPGRG